LGGGVVQAGLATASWLTRQGKKFGNPKL
jgi:hypothetical protein